MRKLAVVVGTLGSALISSSSALGADGVLEINQVCAQGSGCFAGDTPGYPVTITAPGSFRLTGNLAVTGANETVILVQASSVTIDLGGFEISGPTTCSGTPTTCTPASGLGRGVDSGSFQRVTVRNGTIRGMGNNGIDLGEACMVEGVRTAQNRENGVLTGPGCVITGSVSETNGFVGFNVSGTVAGCNALWNGNRGITVGPGSTVQNSLAANNFEIGISGSVRVSVIGNTARQNLLDGINVGSGSTVIGNSSTDNDEDGIEVGQGSTVTGNSAFFNGGGADAATDDGIASASGCLVHGNTSSSNTGFGLRLAAGSGYRENVISSNTTGGVTGGATNLGDNLCSGPGVVSPSCP